MVVFYSSSCLFNSLFCIYSTVAVLSVAFEPHAPVLSRDVTGIIVTERAKDQTCELLRLLATQGRQILGKLNAGVIVTHTPHEESNFLLYVYRHGHTHEPVVGGSVTT